MPAGESVKTTAVNDPSLATQRATLTESMQEDVVVCVLPSIYNDGAATQAAPVKKAPKAPAKAPPPASCYITVEDPAHEKATYKCPATSRGTCPMKIGSKCELLKDAVLS